MDEGDELARDSGIDPTLRVVAAAKGIEVRQDTRAIRASPPELCAVIGGTVTRDHEYFVVILSVAGHLFIIHHNLERIG